MEKCAQRGGSQGEVGRTCSELAGGKRGGSGLSSFP